MIARLGTIHTTRRGFVARVVAGAASISLVPLLNACASSQPSPTTAPSTAPAATQPPAAASPTSAPKAAQPTSAPTAAPTAAPTIQPTAASGQPVPGGKLRVTLGAEPTTLDPHKTSTLFDADVRDALFDGLIECDVVPGVRGALAESWESPDAKSWTFRLRKGVKFHDGSELTSEIVKASLERVVNPATAASGQVKPLAAQIVSIATPDTSTIKLELKVPNAAFPLDLSDIKIIPKDFDATKPVGTGPFQFAEWVRNRHVQLKKFPDHFRKGLPYLDEIVFLPTPDENQKIVLLQTGQVDFTDTIPLPRVKEVQDGGKIVVTTVAAGVSPSSYFMLARTDRPPLDNAKVRQAINFAIDRKAMLDVTFSVGTIKSNVVPPKSWAFNPDALSFNDRDVAKAKQLLAEGGHANGFSVQLKHITSRAEYATMAQLFQANMAEIGVKVEIIPQEIGVWVEQVLNKNDFQLGLTGIIPRYDPDAMLRRFDPALADGKAMNWKDDEFLKLLDEGRAEVDEAKRKQIYFRAQEIAQKASPGFVINERPILYGASPAVQGFQPDIRQHMHFAAVWLKK